MHRFQEFLNALHVLFLRAVKWLDIGITRCYGGYGKSIAAETRPKESVAYMGGRTISACFSDETFQNPFIIFLWTKFDFTSRCSQSELFGTPHRWLIRSFFSLEPIADAWLFAEFDISNACMEFPSTLTL